MSYSVEYSPELNKKYPMKRKQHFNQKKWVMIAVICFIVTWAGKTVISHCVIGEHVERQKERIGTMLTQIREGTAVSDALTTYCLGVLQDAEVY